MSQIIFPEFGSYTHDGAYVEVEHEGFTFRATVHQDTDMGPPWEEHDGHGEVSDWTSRAKRPGERVLSKDRDRYRYYDFEGAMEKARKEGWGFDIPWRTPGIARLKAVEEDFRAMKAWCDDEWTWCGVAVTVYRAGVLLTGKYDAALWGTEMNYPGGDNSHLSETAGELAGEAMEKAIAKLDKMMWKEPSEPEKASERAFDSVMAAYDNTYADTAGEPYRLKDRALTAAWWFIENVPEDAPDRQDVFFKVREIVREGQNA